MDQTEPNHKFAHGESTDESQSKAKEIADRVGSAVSSAAGSTKEKIADAAHGSGEALSSAYDSTRDSLAHATERSGEAVRSAGRATQVTAREFADSSRDRIRKGKEEFPLGMALGALAVGFIAGIAFPRTRKEDGWYGERSDELTDRVKSKGQDALDSAKATLEENRLDAEGIKARANEAIESAKSATGDTIEQAKRKAEEKLNDHV